MIYITGDTHGDVEIRRLKNLNLLARKPLTPKDYVIICGDFGLIWDGSDTDEYWLQWLENKNFTTLFIDGNHENFNLLNKYPVEYWNGGKVHFINKSVIHLMRGQIFNIEGMRIFTFGGASSIDKEYRKENISWWEEELPSKEEFEEGLANLKKNDFKVDYIISHCCSGKTFEQVAKVCNFENEYELDLLNEYFNLVEKLTSYKHWYFGHYHNDALKIVKNQSLLYKKIIRIF